MKEAKPLSQEMREGREPLRTFGDLQRFLQPESEPPAEPPTSKKRRQEQKPPEQPSEPAAEPLQESTVESASRTPEHAPLAANEVPTGAEPPSNPVATLPADQDPTPPA